MKRFLSVSAIIAASVWGTDAAAQATDAELPPPPPTAAALPPALEPSDQIVRSNFDAGFDLRFDDAGAVIGSVVASGVAHQAGLRADDRIVSIDGHRLANADEFRATAAGFEGRTVELVVQRNGQPQTISLLYPRTADPRPVDGNRSWIGVSLSPSFAERGALVSRVQETSPASRAGIRAGDVVLALNGEDVVDYRDLIDRISDLIPNTSAELLIYRDGATQSVNTAIGRYEDSNSITQVGSTPAANVAAQRVPTSQELADARLIQFGDRIYRLERMVETLQEDLRALKPERSLE